MSSYIVSEYFSEETANSGSFFLVEMLTLSKPSVPVDLSDEDDAQNV